MADVNVEEIVIGFLDANKSTGWNVYGDMPKTRPTGFVLVDRTGGPREYIVQDRAEIVIEVYHKTSRESASDEANRIADIIKNLEVLEPVMRAKVTSLVKLDDLLGQYWRYQIYCDVFYRRDVSTDGIIYPVIPSSGVTSVNGKIGAVVLAAGDDIEIDSSGSSIVISSTKVSDVQSVNGKTGVVEIDAADVPFDDTIIESFGVAPAADVQEAVDNTVTSFAEDITTIIGLLDDKQPLDDDLTALAAAGNSAVLVDTTAPFQTADETKLDGIEAGAEVNNISDANATDLTDGGTTTLHSHTVTKSDVGLGNVDNTADADKPISTATQAALDNKEKEAIGVTVATARTTAAKVGTTTAGNYTPTYGDRLNVTFTPGVAVNTPTLNIDGSGALNIRIGSSNVSTAILSTTAASITVPLWYDGSSYQMYGSQLNTDTNTTYAEITEAEITAGTASTLRSISGRRSEFIVTKARDGRVPSVDGAKLDGIESGADVTDSTNVDAAGATMNSDTTLAGNGYFLDEDDLTSDDATKVPSQQSVKAYADKKGVLAYDVYAASDTWTKPVGAKVVEVFAIGAGGGGGKAAAGAAGTTRNAGGGGGPGGAVIGQFDADDLAGTVAVTVGAGGTAGTTTGAFESGGAGGASSFGSHVTAGGGQGGPSGNFFLVGNTGGVAGASSLKVGAGSGGAFTGLGFQIPGEPGHVGSGAGGAAISSANVLSPALAGGNSSAGAGGTAGGTSNPGGNGADGSGTNGGAGGGGGGEAQAGGNGGLGGGAGGGGGAATTPAVGGNGGTGGRGIVIVITYG